ncbi:MAG: MaoC family dehydratase N-terminal domain-containing protein [Firmicutes bacterium]|nr:MaoC family dehydratase N-terminal domain-containing protein [Bacillota bacterium]
MYYEEFETGMKWSIEPVEITREEMLAYAHAYDPAPIHADEEYGRRSNFKDIIAPGTLTSLKMLKQWQAQYDVQGTEFVAGSSCQFDWTLPVFAGDVIRGEACISELAEINPKNGKVVIKIDVFNQHDKYVMTTTYETVYRRRPTEA